MTGTRFIVGYYLGSDTARFGRIGKMFDTKEKAVRERERIIATVAHQKGIPRGVARAWADGHMLVSEVVGNLPGSDDHRKG